MVTASRGARKAPPAFQRISLQSWKDGYQSTLDATRTSKNGLKNALNMILRQDGTISQRPGTVRYGSQPVGTVLGEICEFTRRVLGTGAITQNYEISTQVVNGVASIYYRKDGGNWVMAVGKSFDTSARCHFCPISDVDDGYNDQDKVLILNGKDNLSYLDINTLSVIPFVQLTQPAVPTLAVGTGITGTNFPQRYKVTAGNRGETAATIAATTTTQTARSEWSGNDQYIDLAITRVTNAKQYHIYYGTQDGSEVYLASVDDPGTGTTVTWRDSGAIDPNTFRPAPVGDTTAGPIGTRATFINGQIFIVGDRSNPKYVRYGGTLAGHVLDFSPYGGGGYEVVGGNKEIPVNVKSFRKNDGTPAITVLCKGTNGFGKRYILSPQSIGGQSYFSVEEENGNDGTEAPDSVITAKDQLWYLSRDGAKTTLTKAQVQTILSTEGVTDLIQKDISKLNTKSLELSVGLEWENRLYWAVAVGSTRNNQIWVLDLNNERKGAWMLPWNIAADWMWLYNDNSGITHFCVLQNNIILEFSDSVTTTDDNVLFPTGMETGIFTFSPDGKEWADNVTVTFVFENPQGILNVGVTAKTEDNPLAPLAAMPFTADIDVSGWGESNWGDFDWSDSGTTVRSFGQERVEVTLELDEEINWLQCSYGTTTPNAKAELTNIIIQYINTGIKDI